MPKYAEYVFRDLKPGFAAECLSNKADGVASAIVAGQSYGQGSSREHAALCPMYLGVKLLLARSVERIHAANLVNFGILRLIFADDADYARIADGDVLEINDVHAALGDGCVIVRNVTQGTTFETRCDYTPRQRDIVLAGGLLNFMATRTGASA